MRDQSAIYTGDGLLPKGRRSVADWHAGQDDAAGIRACDIMRASSCCPFSILHMKA